MDYLAAVAAIVLAVAGITASATAAEPSEADQQCLACHGMPGLEKPLANGETLPLHVAGDSFAQSVHAGLGCTGCHADVSLDSHPPANNTIGSRREFSVARADVCGICHSEQFTQWGKSVHAALARGGNPAAPICTSCHSPHAVMKGAAAALDTVPCKACHGPIFTAYSESVHGKARAAGVAGAPLCFDCHGAHGVNVASAGEGRKPVCLGCHADALAAHRSWLPNAGLHLDVVSCPACHAPRSQRKVDLILYNSATQTQIPEPVGVPAFAARTGPGSAQAAGLDPRTLVTLLGVLNRPGTEGKTSLKGRLTVRTGVEAHELAGKEAAVSNCNTCHQAGAAAFQSVTVSVAGPGGLPVRYGADEEVLNSAFSIESVGGFYAIGGTRITFLDMLFLLALFTGIAVPVVHLAAKWGFRRYLNGKARENRQG